LKHSDSTIEPPDLSPCYLSVSGRIFKDEEGNSFQFTWRTLQTWWYYYRRDGVTKPDERNDKGVPRKATPEELLDAIEQALPFFSGKRYSVTAIYKKCIQAGFLRQSQRREGATDQAPPLIYTRCAMSAKHDA